MDVKRNSKRNTIQRQLVFDAVKELACHANSEQVYEYVAKKYPSISKGTVYRNLNQMSESGELLRISNIDGSYRYDHNRNNHYHFICKKCGRVFDVEDYFDDICGRIKNADGFEISSHIITFGGLCPECKEKK